MLDLLHVHVDYPWLKVQRVAVETERVFAVEKWERLVSNLKACAE
jgi:hypothetical protein